MLGPVLPPEGPPHLLVSVCECWGMWPRCFPLVGADPLKVFWPLSSLQGFHVILSSWLVSTPGTTMHVVTHVRDLNCAVQHYLK